MTEPSSSARDTGAWRVHVPLLHDAPEPLPTTEWNAHVWLSCGCGGNYTLSQPPAVGDHIWCYFDGRYEKVQRFRAVKREVVNG